MLNFFIFRRFKRLISGENIFLNQLHLKDEIIVTYLFEAHLGFLADLSKFVDCPSNLPSNVKNPWSSSLLLTLLIPGFVDPCSTGGGHKVPPPLRKVANIAGIRGKLGTMVYTNEIYTIGSFFISHYTHNITMTSQLRKIAVFA